MKYIISSKKRMTSKDLYPSCRHYQLGAGVGPEDVSIIVDFNNGRLGNQVRCLGRRLLSVTL